MKLPFTERLRRAQPLLGTFVEIDVKGFSRQNLFRAVSEAFARIQKVHDLMSFHCPGSDVSKLNRLALRKKVAVHPWTYRVLTAAQKIAGQTDGNFDVTSAASLISLGFLPKPETGQNKLYSMTTASFRDIELGPGRSVRFKRPLMIDLGGIAKGFAVDQAVRALKRRKVPCGAVNAGGDLRVFGGLRQPVYVRHPKNPGQFLCIGRVEEMAVATSATYFTRKCFNGRWVAPFAVSRNGLSCQEQFSVSVIAGSCLVADALTKVVISQPNGCAPFLKRFHARAVIVREDRGGKLFEARHAG